MSLKLILLTVVFVAIVGCGGDTNTDNNSSDLGSTKTTSVNQNVVVDLVQGEGTCYIIGELVDDCPVRSPHLYQGPVHQEGVYWQYHSYEGSQPTDWYESPMSYQLVKTGELPPLDARVPPPEDRGIVQGPDGIGEYGGSYRQTGEGLYLGEWVLGTWAIRDSNGIDWKPWIGKSFDVSEDGRTYTMKLRKNLKWSDGIPFEMSQIEYAWNDVNFNKELNPVIPLMFRDPVTDNPVKFEVLDDLTWTITFDTPVYNLFENRSLPASHCQKGGFSFYCHPDTKQYHADYADPAAIKNMVKSAGMQDWTQLFTFKNDILVNPRPCLSAWCTTIIEDTRVVASRNHYYHFFDPEGNQLPYADEAMVIAMQSRPAAVFRSMNGENDGQTSPFFLSEVPVYNANLEKGDYSVYQWPSTGGNDAAVVLNQTFNDDPFIGKLIRTRDFRKALSYGINRETINDNVFLGAGVIQSWAPHKSTPYYPGDEVANRNIEFNIDKANELLDSLGLNETDAEGFRLRTDSGRENEPILLDIVMYGEGEDLPIGELVSDMWNEIGIKSRIRLTASTRRDFQKNIEYLTVSLDFSAYQANPWAVEWGGMTTLRSGSLIGTAIGEYNETRGAKGMAKDPDPEYLPLAPEDAFPADATGNLGKLNELWKEGRAYKYSDPRRIEIGKQMFDIFAQEQYAIPTVGFTATIRGIFLNRNNVHNQPKTHIRDHNGFHAWTYFFEGGKDNYHNLGNRSSVKKSYSFMGGM